MSRLVVEGLGVTLGARTVLEGIGLAADPGTVTALIGPNGAGKSTLLSAIAGTLPATGRVTIGGRDIAALNATGRARLISVMPQERALVWPMPVEDVVALGRLPHRLPFRGLAPADHAAIDAALALADATPLRHRSATSLSGGEKARVLLARLLAQETPVILADEPTAGLDPAHQITAMRALAARAREGAAVVVTLHDLDLALRHCDRLVLLDAGMIASQGPAADVLTPERMRTVYGIEATVRGDGRNARVEITGLAGTR